VLNEHNIVFGSKWSAVWNSGFNELIRVIDANGIAVASAVFVGFTRWRTDYRPRYSVGNNRRQVRS